VAPGATMSKYRLVVFTNPVEGREAEFNDWYSNKHLGDVVATPGFGAAQRFKLKLVCGGEFKQQYLAIYDIVSEDVDGVIKEMLSRAGTEAMPLSEAMHAPSTAFAVFEVCSPVVHAPADNSAK
jgi:hypothetical protein